jgi:NAD(P)H-hydrate epimerase
MGMGRERLYRSHDINVLDENSAYLGVPRSLLMENSGAAVARVVEKEEGDVSGVRILVVAGPGNNGGDALVAARHLASRGAKVSVILLSEPERIRTSEAQANWAAIERMVRSVERFVARDQRELEELAPLFGYSEVIIDGIFGTGIRGEIREPFRTAINMINDSSSRVYSVDVPSGVDPDTGAYSLAVKPHVTIALHGAKPFMAAPYVEVGKVYVESIGAQPESELIAGPGDLLYARSHVGKIRSATVRGYGEAVEIALGALREVGIDCEEGRLESGLVVEMGGVRVSDRHELLARPGDVLVIPSEAPRPGEALSLSRKLGHPVYIVGGQDMLSDGSLEKSNWVEPPVEDLYTRGVLTALIAYFASQTPMKIYGLAAACYAVRAALRGVGSEDWGSYIERLRSLAV